MPIYEFYCKECNTLFNFFSKTINTKKIPKCPKCKIPKLSRQVSFFAIGGKAVKDDEMEDLPFDESKMEKAMAMLAGEAENINEEDPKQAADLMRKLSDMSGLKMGQGMEEALNRLEKGEDPESIEADLGDVMESEGPFVMGGKKGSKKVGQRPPIKDDTLYDL